MADEFFRSPQGWWFLSNLSDDDYLNQNNPTVAGVFQNPPTNDTLTTTEDTIYESLEAAEATSKLTCTVHILGKGPFLSSICGVKKANKRGLNKHKKKVHTENLVDNMGQSVSFNASGENDPHTSAVDQQSGVKSTKLYNCRLCGCRIEENKLKKHHRKCHDGVPFEEDIFTFNKIKFEKKCEFCRRTLTLTRFDNHMKKVHPEKLVRKIQSGIQAENQPQAQPNFKSIETNIDEPIGQVVSSNAIEQVKNLEITKKSEMKSNFYEKPIAAIIQLPVYKCKICNQDQLLEENFSDHQHRTEELVNISSMHTDFTFQSEEKQLVCTICGFKLKENQMKKLNRHIKKAHPEIPFDNIMAIELKSEQSKAYSNSQKLVKVFFPRKNIARDKIKGFEEFGKDLDKFGTNTIHVYECTVCEQSYLMEPFLQKHHYNNHREISYNRNIFEFINVRKCIQCFMCRKLLSENQIEAHLGNCHLHEPVYFADNKTEREPSEVNQIVNTNPQEKREPSTHIDAIEISKVFKCSLCSANGILKRNLSLHHTLNHKDTTFELKSFLFSGVTIEVKCQYCGKQLRKNILAKHISLFHPEVAIGPVQLYKCIICDTNDIKIYDLNEHHLIQHNEIPVTENIFQVKVEPVREIELSSEENVESVLEEMSADFVVPTKKWYKCGFCKSRRIPEDKLKDHHSEKHGEIPFETNKFLVTMVESKEESNSKQKISTVAPNPNRCDKSPAMRVDTGALNQYQCKICGANGLEKIHLEEHHSTEHSNISMSKNIFKLIPARQVECDFCAAQLKKNGLNGT
ncbi:zinc finger protein 888-like [Sitodiplosis mosellana]|uniref:zinc finger protein 888-like n=1 Tax=Sitodiplosis mosellana TaxID=263140 RepID=UPI002443E972|nr:zinc finger protein 888-like [Sitodiplosis mosellana]